MKTSLKELLIKHEGWKNKPYKCPAGFKTIGVGWNMDANRLPSYIAEYLKEHGEITDAMVYELLNISIEIAVLDCKDLFPDFEMFSDNRKMALIDFVFQLGLPKARKFIHAMAAINTGRWEDAAEEMRDSNWYDQTPNRAREIIDLIEAG